MMRRFSGEERARNEMLQQEAAAGLGRALRSAGTCRLLQRSLTLQLGQFLLLLTGG